MKKQIFSFILAAAIFSTSSAFCMEREQEYELGILCRLSSIPGIHSEMFKNLSDPAIRSLFLVSKLYNKLVTTKIGIGTLYLNVFLLNATSSRLHDFEEVAFSLYFTNEGKDRHFIKNIPLYTEYYLPRIRNCVRPKTLKISFPKTGRLSFLIESASENLEDIPLYNKGYKHFDDLKNTIEPERSKIAKSSVFNLELRVIESTLMSGCVYGVYTIYNANDEKDNIIQESFEWNQNQIVNSADAAWRALDNDWQKKALKQAELALKKSQYESDSRSPDEDREVAPWKKLIIKNIQHPVEWIKNKL
ncbi:MAG: hypothetical protein H0X26_02830 [Alphaproteobacteria bacterium]|nr:hypothetical protein [Alphaproteobacteria bacterium]